MSRAVTVGSNLGNGLNDLLMAGEITPGDQPSYTLCKIIYTLHPIGKKMVDAPITKAQSQQRIISVPDSPEQAVVEQFERVWKKIKADKFIRQTFRLSRIYGYSTICAMPPKAKPIDPIDYPNLWKVADQITFNVLDPLNTSAGSALVNQDPNNPDFLKVHGVVISGVPYNPARCVVIQNEDPIYIDYTSSAFGYTGRSVFQRALLPLKSFIQSMLTDDLVTIKAGVLVAKMTQPGAFVDRVMRALQLAKSALLKIASIGGVLTIGEKDEVTSLDLTNIPQAMTTARKNILENIATAADMPAMLLNNETFAEGFADGTEDAKAVVEYIDSIRIDMQPLYDYFDQIVRYIAWSPAFYETIQKRFPEEWGKVDYTTAFYRWSNSFVATWPSLLREPESEQIKKEAVKLESLIAQTQVLLPILDPINKVKLIEYMVDNFNALKLLFPNPLIIESDILLDFLEEQQSKQEEQHEASLKEPSPNKKFGDAAEKGLRLRDAIRQLPPPVRGKVRESSVAAA